MSWYLILNSGGGRLVGSLCVLCVLRPPWICSRQLCSEVIILFMVIIIVLISLKIIPTESRVRKFRQAPRLTIRRAIWILASNTDTVFVNSTNISTNIETARLSTSMYYFQGGQSQEGCCREGSEGRGKIETFLTPWVSLEKRIRYMKKVPFSF